MNEVNPDVIMQFRRMTPPPPGRERMAVVSATPPSTTFGSVLSRIFQYLPHAPV
eukprot:CAMPEP_0167802730 /NCGR_PEP_ID=MMETSP0111_2-20121227/19318_1 /TAXON_ID=91324 /ORGANISM="Lotharella globosa, Strain CCCM811" /LENGTH=53 /DNA_ID=CAMNT_0007698871 /DNA_START=192 /DNA_END=353 /DNA_ORIENTATION=-